MEVGLALRVDEFTTGLAQAKGQLQLFSQDVARSSADIAASGGQLSLFGEATTQVAGQASEMGTTVVTTAATSGRAIGELNQVATEGLQSIAGNFGILGRRAAAGAGQLVTALTSAGGAIAAVGAAAGVVLTLLAVHAVNTFMKFADEVRQFTYVTGASAEQASQVVDVLGDFGISAQEAGQSFLYLNNQINNNAELLAADGINIAKNADGTTDLIGTLLNVTDAYQAAGGGAEGLTIAADALGRRTAQNLLPILNQGRAAVEAMFRSSIELSQDDLDKTLELKLAKANLGDAVRDLEIALARGLVPAFTTIAGLMTEVVSAGEKVVGVFTAIWDKTPDWIKKGVSLAANAAVDTAIPLVGAARAINSLSGEEKGNDDAAAAITNKAKAERDAAKAADDLKDAVDALNDQLDDYVDKALGGQDASDQFKQGLIDLATSLRDDGAAIDSSTSAGLRHREMLSGLVDSAANLVKSGHATSGQLEQMAADLYATATAFGLPKEEAARYAEIIRGLGQYLHGLPPTTMTKVQVDTTQATGAISDLAKMVGNLGLGAILNPTGKAGPSTMPFGPNSSIRVNPDTGQVTGLNPYTTGVAYQPDPVKAEKAGRDTSAEDAERAAEEARRNEDSMAAHGFINNETYRGILNARLGLFQQFSQDWFATLDKLDSLAESERDLQDRREDQLAAAGLMTNDTYRAVLSERLASLQQFSDEWFDTHGKIAKIDADAAAAQQKAADEAKKAAEEAKKIADDEAEERRKGLEDQAKALATRRDQLAQWADPFQVVRPGWGNSAQALTRNVNDQTAQLIEWATGLDSLMARGLSKEAVDLLGLSEGPMHLGDVRQLLKGSDAQLNQLDSAVSARMSIAGNRAIGEAGISGEVLAAITAAAPQVFVAPPVVNLFIDGRAIQDAVRVVLGGQAVDSQIAGAH